MRRLCRHYLTCRTGTVSPPPPVRLKAGMPAMTRRKQGLTRREGRRPVYRQTSGLYPSLIDRRKVVDLVTWNDPGVAPSGSPLRCSSKGQGLRLLALVGFATSFRTAAPGHCRGCAGSGACSAFGATGILQPAVQAAISGLPRSLRLAVQDAALSRQKQGFESPRECHSIAQRAEIGSHVRDASSMIGNGHRKSAGFTYAALWLFLRRIPGVAL